MCVFFRKVVEGEFAGKWILSALDLITFKGWALIVFVNLVSFISLVLFITFIYLR